MQDGFSVIPMWIADMSFPTAPAILQAMRSRLDFSFFGYYSAPAAMPRPAMEAI